MGFYDLDELYNKWRLKFENKLTMLLQKRNSNIIET